MWSGTRRRLDQAEAHLKAAVATAPDDIEVRLARDRILAEIALRVSPCAAA